MGGPINTSVPPEALVETEFGMRPISTVESGQKVWAAAEDGISKLIEVDQVLTHTDDEQKIKITLENGETFVCSPGDRVLLTNGRWLRVDALRESDDIMVNQER